MANNPKKVKDPTEVALSAIQEALNISDTTIDSSRNPIGGELSPPTMPSAPPAYSEAPFDTRGSADRQCGLVANVTEWQPGYDGNRHFAPEPFQHRAEVIAVVIIAEPVV